jgi:hypothetical protein
VVHLHDELLAVQQLVHLELGGADGHLSLLLLKDHDFFDFFRSGVVVKLSGVAKHKQKKQQQLERAFHVEQEERGVERGRGRSMEHTAGFSERRHRVEKGRG